MSNYSEQNAKNVSIIVLCVGFAAFFLFALCFMHSDDASATKTLTDAGFRNILIEGYSYLGCSDEPYHTKFTATNYNGIVVHGIVCGGPFKYNTIRFN